MSNYPLRCGRLDEHEPHGWKSRYLGRLARPQRTYTCSGHVVTTLAEQEWADRADFDEARDDEMRDWWREGMVS